MSRYVGGREIAPILNAADHWRSIALEQDGAMFGAGPIWTLDNAQLLVSHFVENFDTGEGRFLDKLKTQIAKAGAGAIQLCAEMQWVMLLCPSNIGPDNKRDVFHTVWSWIGKPLPGNDPWLTDEVLRGIGSGGTGFNTNRWRELAYLIRLIEAFKSQPKDRQTEMLADPWQFSEFVSGIDDADARQLRHMLLYLLWPDVFERVFGGSDRRAIVAAFTGEPIGGVNAKSPVQVDRILKEIRTAAEAEYGTRDLDFYNSPLRERWKADAIPDGITREHVLLALAEIDKHGVPAYAASKGYDLLFEGRRYPPKYVIALAGKHLTGEELDRSQFPGGERSETVRLLRSLGFQVVPKDAKPEPSAESISPGPGGLQEPAPERPSRATYTLEDMARETELDQGLLQGWLRQIRRKGQIVIQGPPGTGKTFVAERLARVLVSNSTGFVDLVQFHPSYSYEDFIQGIRPQATNLGVTFRLQAGRFLDFCAKASKTEDPCVLIVDELNRANLSRVFGELMFLLEYREREIALANGGTLSIPRNAYIVATMNTADRSIALVDFALRRRFGFVFLAPQYDSLVRHLQRQGLPHEGLVQALREINTTIGDRHYELGPSYFLSRVDDLRADIQAVWTSEIEPYLEEYFYDQPEKVEEFRWGRLSKTLLADWT